MKTPGEKKKTHKRETFIVEDKEVIEAPKNLLPEHSENKEVAPDIKEEAKSPAVKEDLVTPTNSVVIEEEKKPEEVKKEAVTVVKEQTTEVKSDDVVLASAAGTTPPVKQVESVTTPSQVPPPPISVRVSNFDMSDSVGGPAKKKSLGIILAVVLLLVTVGAWYFLSKKSDKIVKSSEPIVLVSPTTGDIAPTKVASEEVKLDKYPIRVLNGSGIVGEASKVKELLEDEGFKVSETGNADEFNHTDTIVETKKGVEMSFTDKLKTILAKSYFVGKDGLADASDSSDVVVIIGSKKAEK